MQHDADVAITLLNRRRADVATNEYCVEILLEGQFGCDLVRSPFLRSRGEYDEGLEVDV
jgi:hypothetical protein